MRTSELKLTIEVLPAGDGEAEARVKAGNYTLFYDYVYDNEQSPAERNIMLLFSSRLYELLHRGPV